MGIPAGDKFPAHLASLFNGLTIWEAARLSGFPPSQVSDWVSGSSIPEERRLNEFLDNLDVSFKHRAALLDLRKAALSEAYKRAKSGVRAPAQPGDTTNPASVVVHGGQVDMEPLLRGDVTVYGGQVSISGRDRRDGPSGPPPLVKDVVGRECKPDPSLARSEREFVAAMRAFRKWAGNYSTRKLSCWSGGAFSHTTISTVLSGKTRATLLYVQGFIRACGADETEVELWSTSFREVYEGFVRSNPMAPENPRRVISMLFRPDRQADLG